MDKKTIGIIGGVGPYAGIDLVKKIFDQTYANSDQEHLPVLLISMPGQIVDRTAFILGQTGINPAYAIYQKIKVLEKMGVDIVGIPCNTTHSPQIMNVIVNKLKNSKSKIKLINMVSEVGGFILENFAGLRNVGVLSTTGTYKSGVYQEYLDKMGLKVIVPDEFVQENLINKAIYDPKFGIKAQSNPVTEKARNLLMEGSFYLERKGAEAVVLGCTEIPLAFTQNTIGNAVVIDSTLVLARALIREAAQEKLKPLGIDFRIGKSAVSKKVKCTL